MQALNTNLTPMSALDRNASPLFSTGEEHTTVAVNLSKSVSELAVSRESGRFASAGDSRAATRPGLFSQRPPATVLFGSVRLLPPLGPNILLLPPHLATRSARLNAIRAVLRELGIVIPQGSCHVLPDLTVALSEPAGPVPEHLRATLLSAASEIRQLESMAGSLVAMEIAGHETDAVFRR